MSHDAWLKNGKIPGIDILTAKNIIQAHELLTRNDRLVLTELALRYSAGDLLI